MPSDPNKQPSEGTSPAEELKLLQGEWEVYEAQQSSGSTSPVMPKETGLTEKGTRLVIRGNELLRDGKVIATLANDLTELAPELLTDVKPFRRPLLITLPSGKAVLCAYDKRHLDVLDIATPTTGNVGFGYRIYIGRPKR